ncbi:MAG: Holliday junction resolvase RuvX [Patescibacteria group bacterium]|jgi:putative Holliday junction resolvase|nr:Holliday junction resolvase RuvX [Patescibacteria group bacterium]
MNRKILALDLGQKKIGLAIGSSLGLSSTPLMVLENNPDLLPKLSKVIADNQIDLIIIGRPRNIDGSNTDQTVKIIAMGKELMEKLKIKNYLFEDEFLSSKRANEIISQSKKYRASDEDMVAASLILDDYLLRIN